MVKKKGKKDKNGKKMPTFNLDPSDPNLYFGDSSFVLPNGDLYSGEYCAHRYGLIWRHGKGIYTTREGHVYEGKWKQDRLEDSEVVNIKYTNGTEYSGFSVAGKYCGPGIYSLGNKIDISCEFAENKPVGNVVLVDPLGRLWSGN